MEGDQSFPPTSVHGLSSPHSHSSNSPQTSPCSLSSPPFPLLPSASLRADVSLAATKDMETISSSGSARPGRSPGSQRSPAKASSKIMFLGASTQNHLENMKDCSLTTKPHSQHHPLALALSQRAREVGSSSSPFSSPGDDPAQGWHRAARGRSDSVQLRSGSVQHPGAGEAGAGPGPGSDIPAGAHPAEESTGGGAGGQGLM